MYTEYRKEVNFSESPNVYLLSLKEKMNEVLNVIKNRTSLRNYDNRDISVEDLNTIIESAMRAPTAGNMMFYSIIVIKDKDKKLALSKTCDNQAFIAKAPVLLLFVADMQRQYDYYKVSGVKEYCKKKGLDYTAPSKGDFLLACSDALVAAQNAVIAGESLGIGSCYIGDIMENYEKHKKMLNLPPWAFPICMLTFGYYKEDEKKIIKSRFDKKYIVFEEEYKNLNHEDFKEMYKEKEKYVVKGNKFNAENFGQLIYGRKSGSDFMKEMNRSVEVALKFWDRHEL
ncbi:nitroreductase family protein [Haloimpatiens sp. FM7315]|uniref:nitroreductase family protein n=1 Tax=Haloimpatiens sp. FM7315 TaxID=3298609 RepID=UPI0035A2C09E